MIGGPGFSTLGEHLLRFEVSIRSGTSTPSSIGPARSPTHQLHTPMKLRSNLPIFALVASLAVLIPSISLGADAAEPAKPAGDDSGNAVVVSTVPADLRNCEFERRDEFVTVYKAKLAALNVELEKLRAKYPESKATARLKQAMAELATSKAGFEGKLSDANAATVETWHAARDNVAASWDTLQAAYSKANEGG